MQSPPPSRKVDARGSADARSSADACLSWQKVQGREANRRRHRLTEPTTKALCQAPPPRALSPGQKGHSRPVSARRGGVNTKGHQCAVLWNRRWEATAQNCEAETPSSTSQQSLRRANNGGESSVTLSCSSWLGPYPISRDVPPVSKSQPCCATGAGGGACARP